MPEFREYERASTTALSAYVQPIIDAVTNGISSFMTSATTVGEDGKNPIQRFIDDLLLAFTEFQVSVGDFYDTYVAPIIDKIKNGIQGFFDNLGQIDGESLRGALEAAIPGIKFLERGKITEAEIATEFRKVKSTFVFPHAANATEQGGDVQ